MNLHDIRNMGFAELKANRAEILVALDAVPVSQVNNGFVHALTDAKGRDELLAKQGKTITALQDGLYAATAQAEAAKAVIAKRDEQLLVATGELTKLGGVVATLEKGLAAETARADRLKAEASRNHAAVSGAAKLLNDALAVQAVEAADKGE